MYTASPGYCIIYSLVHDLGELIIPFGLCLISEKYCGYLILDIPIITTDEEISPRGKQDQFWS